MESRLRVLGVFPHPDDEAYSCAGTLARLAGEGAEITILCASAGEAGQDLRSTKPEYGLGVSRRAELSCSCKLVGAMPPGFLDLPDGGIAQVNFAAVVGELVSSMRAIRPHIVLSLGADGVYGHPDHLALHRLLVAAYGAAPGGERFPVAAFGPGWKPKRLFLAAFPRGMFRPMYEHMLDSEHQTSIRSLDPDSLGVEPSEVAAAVDIRAYSDRKLAAISCHRSQLRDGDPYTLFPGDLVRRLLTTELFTLGAGRPVSGRLRSLSDGIEL